MDSTTKLVINSYVKAITFVAGLAFIAWLLAVNISWGSTTKLVKPLQIFSTILMGAALGKKGYDIQTWGGKTRAEKLNNRIFVVLSALGYFVLIFSLYL